MRPGRPLPLATKRRRRTLAAFLLVVLVTVGTSGCLSFQVAHVPDKYLEGVGGNGWEKVQNRSMPEPASEWMGFKKTQTLVYADRATDGEGYPGTLTLITLRSLSTANPDTLKDLIKAQVKEKAEAGNLAIKGDPVEGSRALGNGATSTYFVYTGTVSATGFFTEKNAEARIIGEVWTCDDAKTNVIAVGFAQVASRTTTGGIQLPGGTPASSRGADTTTWNEIVADPKGGVGSIKGDRGLIWNVAC
ncbi:MAG TPA: hypothetical protein VNZ52_06790 [Candidatus Thermoplasmatota archaeon]|nr:hypothetical protein [Candidatus Thermoplasmatota archaeon]